MAVIRAKATVIGNAAVPGTNGQMMAVTMQKSVPSQTGDLLHTQVLDQSVASSFPIGTAVTLYYATAGADVTAIEGAVAISKKFSNKD